MARGKLPRPAVTSRTPRGGANALRGAPGVPGSKPPTGKKRTRMNAKSVGKVTTGLGMTNRTPKTLGAGVRKQSSVTRRRRIGPNSAMGMNGLGNANANIMPSPGPFVAPSMR